MARCHIWGQRQRVAQYNACILPNRQPFVALWQGGDWELEELHFNAQGVVMFDGGQYSAGPEFIGEHGAS